MEIKMRESWAKELEQGLRLEVRKRYGVEKLPWWRLILLPVVALAMVILVLGVNTYRQERELTAVDQEIAGLDQELIEMEELLNSI